MTIIGGVLDLTFRPSVNVYIDIAVWDGVISDICVILVIHTRVVFHLASSDTPNITLFVSRVARSDTPNSCDAMRAKSNPPTQPSFFNSLHAQPAVLY